MIRVQRGLAGNAVGGRRGRPEAGPINAEVGRASPPENAELDQDECGNQQADGNIECGFHLILPGWRVTPDGNAEQPGPLREVFLIWAVDEAESALSSVCTERQSAQDGEKKIQITKLKWRRNHPRHFLASQRA